MSSPMKKLCDGERILDGASMKVQQFCSEDLAIGDISIICCRRDFSPLGHVLGDIYWDILSLRKNLRMQISLVDIPG